MRGSSSSLRSGSARCSFVLQRVRTGRILDGMVTHAIWSLAIFVVFPFA